MDDDATMFATLHAAATILQAKTARENNELRRERDNLKAQLDAVRRERDDLKHRLDGLDK